MSKQLQRAPVSSPRESDLWQHYMQRRVMQLLFRYDQKLFQGQFRTFYTGSTLPTLPILQFYDRHLKVQLFSAELLDDILPRVRRQWSLQTNQLALQEEPPVRGEIDWQRTIERTMEETPDHPPLRFDTRLRQQSMRIPENVLVVAILLRYRQMVQQTLSDDQREEMLSSQERQQLVSLDERLERELATPHTRALLADARHQDIEALITRVNAQLRPGNNSYRDLIAWWEQVSSLYIGQAGDRVEQRHLTLLPKRKDVQMAQWLYELWLALEFLTLFHEIPEAKLADVVVNCDVLCWSFRWQERRFHFRFQRQLSPQEDETGQPDWVGVPVLRPNFAIAREHPLKIEHKGALIWQEPPFVMAATYLAQERVVAHLGAAVQQALGMMRLHSVQKGALFTTNVGEPGTDQRTVQLGEGTYADSANATTMFSLYGVIPTVPLNELQERLRVSIQQAVSSLPERAAPACHGFMLDADTVNASNDGNPQEYNIVCPKPHVGPAIFDLVHRDRHCLKDPRLCHVMGQAILPPRISRVVNLEDLKVQVGKLREYGAEALRQVDDNQDEEQAEQLSNQILLNVGNMIEQYVRMHGDVAQQEKFFRDGLFKEYWRRHERCLTEETRNILLSGEYVWDEYQNSNLKDWAAPAIQYCRALERELKLRLYYPAAADYTIQDHKWTLGTLTFLYRKRFDLRRDDQRNWDTLTRVVTRSGASFREFEQILKRMHDERISDLRNELAHGRPITSNTAEKLRDEILGFHRVGLLRWLVENLEPA